MTREISNLDGRIIRAAGAFNIRDVGGYPTVDGRRTRWRTLLRADSVHALPEESQASLLDLGLRTVIDLRREAEVEREPSVFSRSSRVRHIHLSLLPDELREVERLPTLPAIYQAVLDKGQRRIGEVFRLLSEPGTLPALVHCSAGKDRTGLVTALALKLAGVPDEVVAEDYALTATCLTDEFMAVVRQRAESLGYPWEMYRHLMACSPEFMLETLAYLDERHGGAESYLRRAGVDAGRLERLRNALVAEE